MPPMIVGITCVRDEADVIESFVRHNLLFVDRLYVVDNASRDKTLQILLALHREGLPLELRSCPDLTHQQESVMASMVNSLSGEDDSIEFAVLLDADEFICAHSREDLLAELGNVPDGCFPALAWKSYVPKFEAGENCLLSARMCYRREPEGTVQYKAVVPRSLFGRCLVSPGNHLIGTEADRGLKPHLLTARLAHLPIRSRDQALAKLLLHSHTLSMKKNRQPGEGKHWDIFAEAVRENRYVLSDQTLIDFAIRYAQATPASAFSLARDPLPMTEKGTLRYPQWAEVSVIERFDHYVDALISRFQAPVPEPNPEREHTGAAPEAGQ